MMKRETIEVATRGRGFHDLTAAAADLAREAGGDGLLHAFVRHTSASLIITENADPAVRRDLERILARLVPDGDPLFEHDAEGPDDMPAHVRCAITATSITIPVADGRLMMGTWQGLYLWEHRTAPHRRQVVLSIVP